MCITNDMKSSDDENFTSTCGIREAKAYFSNTQNKTVCP